MSPSSPPPTCRRPGCAEPATPARGYCLAHDLRYVQWRAWRDQLHADDLADAGVHAGQQPDPATSAALEVLWRYLTPGPFEHPRHD